MQEFSGNTYSSSEKKLEPYMLYGDRNTYDHLPVPQTEFVVQDLEYLQGMYPGNMKRIQEYVIKACDRMEYKNSPMYDEYPDRLMVNQLCDSVCRQLHEDGVMIPAEEMQAGQEEHMMEAADDEEVEIYEMTGSNTAMEQVEATASSRSSGGPPRPSQGPSGRGPYSGSPQPGPRPPQSPPPWGPPPGPSQPPPGPRPPQGPPPWGPPPGPRPPQGPPPWGPPPGPPQPPPGPRPPQGPPPWGPPPGPRPPQPGPRPPQGPPPWGPPPGPRPPQPGPRPPQGPPPWGPPPGPPVRPPQPPRPPQPRPRPPQGPPPWGPPPGPPPWGPPPGPPHRPPQNTPGRWLNDVVKVLLLNEMHRRRCRTGLCF